MNNTFTIKRFVYIFKKDLLENRKLYLLYFLTLLGLMALITTFQTWNFYDSSSSAMGLDHSELNIGLLSYLSFLFLGCGVFFASTFAMPMNSKLKRISYLVNPSSNFEKYLTRWIITTIGYILAFFIALWVADMVRVAICTFRSPDVDIKFIDLSKLFCPIDVNDSEHFNTIKGYMLPKMVFISMVSLYFLLQSIFILGSTFWEKASFIKTFTAILALGFVYTMLHRWTILLFYGNFEGYNNVLASYQISQKVTQYQAIAFCCIIVSIFTLVFWTLAYFRIKESEIIKRI